MAKSKKRIAEKNLGLFLAPDMGSGAGGFLVPTRTLEVGPGDPGPGDEWAFPKTPTGSKPNDGTNPGEPKAKQP